MPSVSIPYKPRFPQTLIHPALESHRFCVLVAHRRLGKTVLAVNHTIKMALLNPLPNARYAYIAPFLKQAKLIAWDYIKTFSSKLPNTKPHEGDLILELPNGARIYIFGADNPDALRGTYLDGVVLDEFSQIKPDVFGEIIRPALSDRNGWALFTGTPKGQNQFYDIYTEAIKRMAKGDDSWWAGLYRADETNVITVEELDQMRSILSDSSYRQEFLCDFTAASDNVLITIDMVSRSCAREYSVAEYAKYATIIGVDPARFGDDRSVIQVRNGLVADEPLMFKGMDNMTLVGEITNVIERAKPDAVFIDAGRGEGIIDRLRQLGYRNIIEVNFGGVASNPHYTNKRMEMWDLMKEWVINAGKLPNNSDLKADLVTPTYSFDTNNKMKLESKDDIKKRLGRSTDCGDALALTFAMPVKGRNDQDYVRNMPRMAIK